jgi:hypothetical protein
MLRVPVVSLALLVIGSASAAAQTCRGLASFSTTPIQVTGEGSMTAESNTLSAGIGYGFPQSAFGEVGIGTTSNEAFGGSSLELKASVGYQIALGKTTQFHLCPIGSAGFGMGPTNTAGSGVDRSNRSALVGLAFGTSLSGTPRMQIVPSLGLSYAYRRDKAQDNAGAILFEISDHYALAQLGLGFILNSKLALRPRIDIPLGLESSAPTFGLTLGYNFGPGRSSARPH